MMGARELVTEAMDALLQGDLERHLAHVDEAVAWQMQGSPLRQGRQGYRATREALLSSEDVIAFAIVSAEMRDGSEVIRITEEHRLVQQRPTGRIFERQEWFPTSFTVRDGRIVDIRMSAFLAPNRQFRWPS
jgi:ketosteroid isomerase-like protein